MKRKRNSSSSSPKNSRSPKRIMLSSRSIPRLPLNIVKNIFSKASELRRKNIRNEIVRHRQQNPFDSYENTIRYLSLSGIGYSPNEVRNQLKFLRIRNIV